MEPKHKNCHESKQIVKAKARFFILSWNQLIIKFPLNYAGVSPRAIIEVKYVDFQKLTTSEPTAIPPDPVTKRQPRPRSGFVSTTTDFPSFTTDLPEEDDEYIKTNITTQENTPSVKHLYTGTTFSLGICQEQTVFFILWFCKHSWCWLGMLYWE